MRMFYNIYRSEGAFLLYLSFNRYLYIVIWDKRIKKRIIGSYGDLNSDRLLVVLAGVHGNEHAGVKACERIFQTIESSQLPLYGGFIALKGNVRALETNQRFVHRDLNRMWNQTQIAHVKNADRSTLNSEELEQRELLSLLEALIDRRPRSLPFLFIDLHTTSADGGHFSIVNSNPLSIIFAKSIGVPFIKGLERVIKDTTLQIFSEHEYAAIAFEAGQHRDERSVRRMECAIWILLYQMQIVHLTSDQLEAYRAELRPQKPVPLELSFEYKHTIDPNATFRMNPGFSNFDFIQQSQSLAVENDTVVTSPMDGYMLMPLYQPQGEDGFFIVK